MINGSASGLINGLNIPTSKKRKKIIEKSESWAPLEWGIEEFEKELPENQEGFLLLCRVNPSDTWAAIVFGGVHTGVLDWGNGIIENLSNFSGLKTMKYEFNSLNEPIQQEGFKLAKIKYFSAFSGFAGCNFSSLHQNEGVSPFLYLRLNSSNRNKNAPFYIQENRSIRYVDLIHLTWCLNFYNCTDLRRIRLNDYSYMPAYSLRGTNAVGIDYNRFSLNNKAWELDQVAWGFAGGLVENYNLDWKITGVTTTQDIFMSNRFASIKLTDTASLTHLGVSFSIYVWSLEIEDCSNVVTLHGFFHSNNSLKRLILNGLKLGLNLNFTRLDKANIEALASVIGIASGSQTYNITGLEGSMDINPEIFTSKGYTLIR